MRIKTNEQMTSQFGQHWRETIQPLWVDDMDAQLGQTVYPTDSEYGCVKVDGFWFGPDCLISDFRDHLVNAISAIAYQNPDGFTLDLETWEQPKTGYAVAIAATQNSFGREGLAKVVDYAIDHNLMIGGWRGPDGYYFDAIKVYSTKNWAIVIGKHEKQLAIFDLEKLETINL